MTNPNQTQVVHEKDTSRDLATSESSEKAKRHVGSKRIAIESIRCHHGLEKAVVVNWRGHTLHLSTLLEPENIAPLFSGSEWAGTRVWDAAERAIEYLEDVYENELSNTGGGASVLELGCGLGIPGMIARLMGSSFVLLTDQDSLCSQLRKNVAANFSGDNYIHAMPLSWSTNGVHEMLTTKLLLEKKVGFDFVINCDCVYEPLYGTSWKLLVNVIDEILNLNPCCVVISSCERRKADGVDDFLATLRASIHVSDVKLVREYDRIQIYSTRGHIF